jgi:hypothetical protein
VIWAVILLIVIGMASLVGNDGGAIFSYVVSSIQ